MLFSLREHWSREHSYLSTPIREPNDQVESQIAPLPGQLPIPESAQVNVARSSELAEIDKSADVYTKIRNQRIAPPGPLPSN